MGAQGRADEVDGAGCNWIATADRRPVFIAGPGENLFAAASYNSVEESTLELPSRSVFPPPAIRTFPAFEPAPITVAVCDTRGIFMVAVAAGGANVFAAGS